MTEHDLQNLIRLKLSELGWTTFRTNVGKVKLADGRWFDTGLPKGFSDLIALKDGVLVFIEAKIHPNKPTKDQINFLNNMQKNGFKGDVVYSVDEAVNLVKRGEMLC